MSVYDSKLMESIIRLMASIQPVKAIIFDCFGVLVDEDWDGRLQGNRLNIPLLHYITHELKPHYKLGILSNAGDNWLVSMLGAENVALFDSVVLSYQVTLIKPQHEIYHLAARELKTRVDNCLFIDDRPDYVAAAIDVGMKGIVYRSFHSLKKELADMLN